jgi:hypothetical protein
MKAAGDLPEVKGLLLSAQQGIANIIQSKFGLPINFEWMAGDPLKNF